MLEYKYMQRHLIIDEFPGLYRFLPNSATGKTFLCSVLDDLRRVKHVKFHTFTYNNILDGECLEKLLKTDIKILVVDRFDMYDTAENCQILRTIADKGTTVIVDYKNIHEPVQWDGICTVDLKRDMLYVSVRCEK